MPEYEVGQKVMRFDGQPNSKPVEVEITRVGRSVVGIERWGREQTFRMSDGYDSKHTPRTPGLPAYILTLAQHAEQQERQNLTKRLFDLGVAPAGYGGWRYSSAVLQEIVAVLEKSLALSAPTH